MFGPLKRFIVIRPFGTIVDVPLWTKLNDDAPSNLNSTDSPESDNELSTVNGSGWLKVTSEHCTKESCPTTLIQTS